MNSKAKSLLLFREKIIGGTQSKINGDIQNVNHLWYSERKYLVRFRAIIFPEILERMSGSERKSFMGFKYLKRKYNILSENIEEFRAKTLEVFKLKILGTFRAKLCGRNQSEQHEWDSERETFCGIRVIIFLEIQNEHF